MSKPATIDFQCIQEECLGIVAFSVLDMSNKITVTCPECHKNYVFNKELAVKLKKFKDLILCVREAEDILGNTNVAIDIEGHSIKIPYRLILTRLNTMLSLQIGSKMVDLTFRIEPLKEVFSKP